MPDAAQTNALPGTSWVRLAEDGGDIVVTAELDEQVPRIEPEAYGGHEQVVRPGRRPMTPWRGPGQPVLKFGIVLDAANPATPVPPARTTSPIKPGIRTGTMSVYGPGIDTANTFPGSIELDCRALEVLAGGLVPGDPEAPPLVLTGAMLPHSTERASRNRWIIAPGGLEWGDAVRREADGARMRAQATLTLWLYVQDGGLQKVAPAEARPAYKVFTSTRTLNTYTKIAAKRLGSAKLGPRLARLNGARDPNKALAVNTQVRLPTAHTLKLWRREYGIR